MVWWIFHVSRKTVRDKHIKWTVLDALPRCRFYIELQLCFVCVREMQEMCLIIKQCECVSFLAICLCFGRLIWCDLNDSTYLPRLKSNSFRRKWNVCRWQNFDFIVVILFVFVWRHTQCFGPTFMRLTKSIRLSKTLTESTSRRNDMRKLSYVYIGTISYNVTPHHRYRQNNFWFSTDWVFNVIHRHFVVE